MMKTFLVATLAVAALTGCAVVPYGPTPVVGVGVYAAPPPVVYVHPDSLGYAAYGPRGYYRHDPW
jgi:hypothetical protein